MTAAVGKDAGLASVQPGAMRGKGKRGCDLRDQMNPRPGASNSQSAVLIAHLFSEPLLHAG
jgi:hypothetical protein